MAVTRNIAETIALQALGWLVGNDDLLPVFLGATGAAHDPEFLGSVLDFIMMDDAWVIEFCDTHSLPYERLAEARGMLPGGEMVHWT